MYVKTLVWETKLFLHGISSCQISFLAVTNNDSRFISVVLLRWFLRSGSLGVLHANIEIVIKMFSENAVKNL